MNRNNTIKIIVLFLLFFSFQWSSQFAAAQLAEKSSLFFLILMYGGFFLRSLIWVEILRDRQLISAYSLSSLSYLVIPVISWYLLGEEYKSSHFTGGILILAGITVFAIGEQKLDRHPLKESS